MTDFDRVRRTFERAHGDLFTGSRYQAEFYDYSGGTYNPDTGDIEGSTRSSIGTEDVEYIPPSIDTSVRVGGTSFSWDTSIRLTVPTQPLVVSGGETVTIESDTTDVFSSVTVETNGTLEINGTLITKSVTDNGTIDTNGTLTAVNTTAENPFLALLTPLGVDGEKPTEIELTDQVKGETETYELHGYNNEVGSGMILCRLVEQ